ncbi:membrane protein [Sulfitobacter donghicola DSW-25 = KCTC 12864 = JCM 14565]|uniref:Membrane protein n=1 Tax=Sulfitobacter donghicola DSW-25 = KCTC 12864 = JCM 14565 TaxID=1300350 RepID=A0A073IXH2_9RHOB|nr:membrane protein [Sulfitobacter donghicola DSW-25 = KCTC 12864 = JCM 14565]
MKAMQAMNASVRNGVFFPAFFLTPVALALTAILAMRGGFARASGLFGLSAVIYLLFGLFLTMAINVPMNEALATVEVLQTVEDAQQIWNDYSPRWQFWNITRTIASGLSFVVALAGVLSLNSQRKGA